MTDNPVNQLRPEDFYTGAATDAARAIQAGDNAALAGLLDAKAFSPSEKGLRGLPMVVWAASLQKLQAVKQLLAAGADVNAAFDMRGRKMCLLGLAVGSEPAEFYQAVLAHQAAPDGVAGTQSPLSVAIHGKRWDRLDTLLANGANPNHPDAVGLTPLMELAYASEYEQALKLLQRGGDADRKAASGMSFRAIMEKYPLATSSLKGQQQMQVRQWLAGAGR